MEKIDEEKFNKKFEDDLKEIKEKLHAEKPSDEFKQNLQAILEEELNKPIDKKDKVLQFPKLAKNLVAACACLVLFFSGCFTFADDIENVIFKIFGNTDKVVEEAITNGNYKKIDMEYVEDNGVSIKVDYIAVEEDNLYIAFNIITEEKYSELFIDNINITDLKNNVIYDSNSTKNDSTFVFESRYIENRKEIIAYKLSGENINFQCLDNLEIKIDSINLIINNSCVNKSGKWNFILE